MLLFKGFSSSGKKYLVVTKESNDAKEADISMLVEREANYWSICGKVA